MIFVPVERHTSLPVPIRPHLSTVTCRNGPPTAQPSPRVPVRPGLSRAAWRRAEVAVGTALALGTTRCGGRASIGGLAAQNPGHARHLLAEAVELLTPLTSAGLREDFQRSALLHGGYLAAAHLRRRDLEQAASATQAALTRLPGVQSGRCRSLLTRLRRELAGRKRNGWVADLLPELDKAL